MSLKTIEQCRVWENDGKFTKSLECYTCEFSTKIDETCDAALFSKFHDFHEDLIAVERAKVEIVLNHPIFVGFTILYISKTLMYEFHFDYMKKKVSRREIETPIHRHRFVDLRY